MSHNTTIGGMIGGGLLTAQTGITQALADGPDKFDTIDFFLRAIIGAVVGILVNKGINYLQLTLKLKRGKVVNLQIHDDEENKPEGGKDE